MINYEALSNLIIKNPKAASSAFKSFKQALEKDDNSISLTDAYQALGSIVEEQPQLAKEVLELVNVGLQNEKNNGIPFLTRTKIYAISLKRNRNQLKRF